MARGLGFAQKMLAAGLRARRAGRDARATTSSTFMVRGWGEGTVDRQSTRPYTSTMAAEHGGGQTSSLSPDARARGRRLAIASHPLAMTHRYVYTDQLPTLALVALGASEAMVGNSRIQCSQYGKTVLTCVCWSMISEIQIA